MLVCDTYLYRYKRRVWKRKRRRKGGAAQNVYIYTGQAALICMYTNAAPKTSARQQTPTSAGKAQLRRFGDYFNFRQLQTGASTGRDLLKR